MKNSLWAILFAFLLFAFTISTFAQSKSCKCVSATKDDVPSSGNILLVFNEGKVKQLQGVVYFPNGDLMSNAVIEVFKVSKEEIEDENNAYNITKDKKRKKACKTGEDGKFCFKNLAQGFYVLRIGINHSQDKSGMNAVYFIVEINSKNGEEHNIEATVAVAG